MVQITNVTARKLVLDDFNDVMIFTSQEELTPCLEINQAGDIIRLGLHEVDVLITVLNQWKADNT